MKKVLGLLRYGIALAAKSMPPYTSTARLSASGAPTRSFLHEYLASSRVLRKNRANPDLPDIDLINPERERERERERQRLRA